MRTANLAVAGGAAVGGAAAWLKLRDATAIALEDRVFRLVCLPILYNCLDKGMRRDEMSEGVEADMNREITLVRSTQMIYL